MTLKQVAIAAAGRALKTSKVKVEMALDFSKEVNKEINKTALKWKAFNLLEQVLRQRVKIEPKYYCVGYSVIHYYHGRCVIESKGIIGNVLSAEIIATFLPHIVVDDTIQCGGKVRTRYSI